MEEHSESIDRWIKGFLILGIVFRVAAYLADRSFWLDESSLLGNIKEGPTFSLFGPLVATQIAPPGFLLAERVLYRILGDSRYVMRAIPFLGSLVSLFLMRSVALRCLPVRAAVLAVGLLSVSDDQIYYATELKPYSTDVTWALAVLLATLWIRDRPLTPGRFAGFALLGSLAVWFSFPSAFVLAASGMVLIVTAGHEHRWKRAGGLMIVSAIWLSSFTVSHLAARSQIGGDRGLWAFWALAFPPPLVKDPTWVIRRFLYLFVNPLDYEGPFTPWVSIAPALLCALTALVTLLREQRALLGLFVIPMALAIAASYLQLYPFHGRLVLFLVPSLHLLIALGADRIWLWSGRTVVGVTLAIALLANPLVGDLDCLLEPRQRGLVNPFGDFRPPWVMPDLFSIPFPSSDSVPSRATPGSRPLAPRERPPTQAPKPPA